ncbi:MAG TPA: 3-methyl-2-oxobutanoate hydroxymethyltransferase [Aquifex aeolicus]|nr:3-methyl-2-oxobutanoate hydroxymethyltransferase [Aquifex aeolicus]
MAGRITLRTLKKKKEKGEKIVMVSVYDYTFAKLCQEAGIDSVLVGDSLGMVFQGLDTTLPVSLEEMIYHARAVRRGAPDAFMVVDMPFLSYQVSVEEAIRNCGRVMKETGAQAVKLEGGEEIAELVYRLTKIGVPVVGHVGYTPQSVHAFGGPKVVGKEEEEARKLREDFRALESAGAFMIVLESVPQKLSRELTESSEAITVGIGAGRYCDGQVLVLHDILGLYEEIKPRFVRRYIEGYKLFKEALERFRKDVVEGRFPSKEESYGA